MAGSTSTPRRQEPPQATPRGTTRTTNREGRTTTPRTAGGAVDPNALLLDDQKELLMYGGAVILGMIILKAVLNAMTMGIFVLPLLYLYLVQTCPTMTSFDAKRELKRVLRGHHLPESHPEKPKGFLGETFARITATVTAELATATGYEVSTIPVAGCLIFNTVRVPSANLDFYWVGAANKWWYIFSSQIKQTDG